jgi:hypothetical protein
MAFRIPLTKGQFAIVDDGDHVELSKFKWIAHLDDKRQTFYAARLIPSETWPEAKADNRRSQRHKICFMARQILLPPPGYEVDHANRNTLDNRRCNLRLALRRQNMMNRPKWGSKCRFKGMFRNTMGRFTVRILVEKNRRKTVGTFKTEIEAAKAYNEAAKQHYGEFARLNSVEGEG